MISEVLGVEGLGGQLDGDHRHLAFNLNGFLAFLLDGLIRVADCLRSNAGDLVNSLDTALDDFNNVDGVVDRTSHSTDDDLVELLLAFGSVEESDGVSDV